MRTLLELFEGEFSLIYTTAGFDYRTRFTPVLQALLDEEPLSVAQIAAKAGITQPAATQTLRLMTAQDWVTLRIDPSDARRRLYSPSSKARDARSTLRDIWVAAKQVEHDLDAGLSSPLSALLDEAIAALHQHSLARSHRDVASRLSSHTRRNKA